MVQAIYTRYLKTPFGELILGSFREKLCLCDWRCRKARGSIDNRIRESLGADFREAGTDVTGETQKQLEQYFEGERKNFDLPLLPVGSAFQIRVWKALLEIPYGKTVSYAALAERLGDVNAIRAAAAANGANALAIIVPCHRVIGSDGRLTGYAGGIAVKKKLLRLEHAMLQGELDL